MSKHRMARPARRRRVALRLGAASAGVVMVGTGWLAFAPSAGAVTGIQTGYWSALPAAPQVPTGGFEIGSNANGAHALAAIRFTLAPGEVAETLRLKVSQAQPASQVTISACPVAARSASWAPPSGGGPGALSEAPSADCTDGLVAAELSADGATLTVNLSAMSFDASTVDIVLQPNQVTPPVGGAPGEPTQVYPTFDASFQPMTADQISVSAGAVTTQAPPPATAGGGSTSGTEVAPAPAATPPVNLPPASTTDTGGAAPVVAPSEQPTNAALSAPAFVTKKRNLRALFGIGMLSSDVLFLLLWMQNRMPTDERPPLSIYDPPPLAS